MLLDPGEAYGAPKLGPAVAAAGKAMAPAARAEASAMAVQDARLAPNALRFWEHVPPPTPEAPMLLGNPDLRGSMNTLDNIPFTYKGKSPAEWTPQQWEEVGKNFGIPNLGPESKATAFPYSDTGTFNIPGGLEGKFTYYDLLRMKADAINPARIDPQLHSQIHSKLLRTMTPEEGASPAQVWQGLMFGMTSPNNPLFPNHLTSSILRLRDPQLLDQLAGSIPWKVGETVPKEVRKEYNDRVASMFGLQSGEKGGLGSRGTTDYTRIAELAQMYKEKPEWFAKKAGEPWDQYVERLTSQVKGLSAKTGSLSGVWQDPAKADISAIDRHMVNEFDRQVGLFKTPEERAAFEQRAVERWNKMKENNNKQVDSYQQLLNTSGSDGFLGGMKLEYVGASSQPLFRTAKGEVNKNIPPYLANADFPVEPTNVNIMGDAYHRALDWNAQDAASRGLGLFGGQWALWDRIRNRLEPHENMFPGLERMPAMSREQLREVSREHTLSGHKTYGKVTGDDEVVSLKPTRPRPNPGSFGYLTLPPLSLLGLGLARDNEQ